MKRKLNTTLKKTISGKLTLWGIFEKYKKEMQKNGIKIPIKNMKEERQDSTRVTMKKF